MKQLVSIVIPVYNVEQYLDECLTSVLSQTYQNMEVILVDDESSDNSLEICNKWAKCDTRVKVVANQHAGASHTRNTGVNLAAGDLIGFVDSDDIIDSHYVEKLVSILDNNPDCSISTCCIQRYNDGKVEPINNSWHFEGLRYIEYSDFAERLMLMKSQHSSCGKLFKRVILENIHYRDGVSNEDILFYFDLYPYIEANKIRTVELSDTLYYYRSRPGSSCFGKNINMVVAENKNMVLFLAATKNCRPVIYDFYYGLFLENNIYLINNYLIGTKLDISGMRLWRNLWTYRNCYVKNNKSDIYLKFILYKYLFPIDILLYSVKRLSNRYQRNRSF